MKQTLRDALDARGYSSLTPVQEAVLAPEYAGADLLVSAQTGSGKTLGFGLAIADTILDADRFEAPEAPLALVIAPTRELALQVKRELSWLYEKAGAVMASCVGGMDIRDERRALSRGAHIVAATPGRLRDHIMKGAIDLSQLRAVVLDEADEMLDLGFREDLEFILGEAPEDRQTLLFSATVPKSIGELAKSYQKDAHRIVTKSETPQHADIDYRAMLIADRDVDNAVINTLRFYEAPNAIVFANTRAMVARLTTRLSNRGFNVVALSGELTQSERTNALQAMRDGRAQVCVATDVAARGIDLPMLDLVVHAELPSSHETLLHRSGRTGRAGRKGVSALVVTKKTQKKAHRLLGWAKLKAEWGTAPSADEVRAKDEQRMLADPIWEEGTTETELPAVEKLLESFSPQKLATSYLRLLRATRSAPEELSDPNMKPAPREEFGASVWFMVNGGREQNIGPRNLVPMLCRNARVNKGDIGAIRVKKDQSYVQLRESAVPGLAEALGSKLELEPGLMLAQTDEVPEDERTGRGKPAGGRRPGGKFGGKPGGRDDRFDRRGGPREEHRGKAPRDERPRREKPATVDPKSKTKPASEGGFNRPKKEEGSADRKPRHGAKFSDKAKGGDAPLTRSKPKGPPPPKGKPNSKKNKARAAEAKAAAPKKHRKGQVR